MTTAQRLAQLDPLTIAVPVLILAAFLAVLVWFFWPVRRPASARRVFCEPQIETQDTVTRLRTRAGA
jgi:hypothetical protein